MNINQAKRLKVGSTVRCPPDRGDHGYEAVVTSVFPDQVVNLHGTEFLWVEVRPVCGQTKHVWPSNRLG